jgi:hypothetical protein
MQTHKIRDHPADGRAMSAPFPPPGARWRPVRKAQVLAALHAGELTFPEVCERYGLSMEELASWQRSYDSSGKRGLTLAGLARWRVAANTADRA